MSSFHKKQRTSTGFSTARTLMNDQKQCDDNESIEIKVKPSISVHTPTSINLKGNESLFQIQLTIRGHQFYKHNVHSLDKMTLHRQPDNNYDMNAIAVQNGDGAILGHVAKEQAALLAKQIDTNMLTFQNVSLLKHNVNSLIILAEGTLASNDESNERIQSEVLCNNVFLKIIDDETVDILSHGIASMDVKAAEECSFNFEELKIIPYKDRQIWPPSVETLIKFGVTAAADDADWWQTNVGLNPPILWNVTGAFDLLPNLSMPLHQRKRASDLLDGAIHGVTNVLSDVTLNEIHNFMHSPDFWIHRGADAFIKAYGGPYVLGQQEKALKLIKAMPHTSLTEKLCRAYNIVCALIHRTKLPEPGFNTLIFGLNLRRAGFHYHQDSISSLKAKNAPLLPRQPVVTTVYFELPKEDGGKELLLWKPLLNFTPKTNGISKHTCHGAYPTGWNTKSRTTWNISLSNATRGRNERPEKRLQSCNNSKDYLRRCRQACRTFCQKQSLLHGHGPTR